MENFLTEQECDDILRITTSPSPPAGVGRVIRLESRLSESNKSNNEGTAVRLSTTWYVRYGAPQVAPLLRSLLQLLPDIQLEQLEEISLCGIWVKVRGLDGMRMRYQWKKLRLKQVGNELLQF